MHNKHIELDLDEDAPFLPENINIQRYLIINIQSSVSQTFLHVFTY